LSLTWTSSQVPTASWWKRFLQSWRLSSTNKPRKRTPSLRRSRASFARHQRVEAPSWFGLRRESNFDEPVYLLFRWKDLYFEAFYSRGACPFLSWWSSLDLYTPPWLNIRDCSEIVYV
jgi:hypothetical protein